jgi:hypothetical protein
MQMLRCPNCGQLTGFKRALGFGTLFMVILTCGFWLLVIPLYPARCINCGLRRGTAISASFSDWYRDLSPEVKAFAVLIPIAFIAILAISNFFRHARQPSIASAPPVSPDGVAGSNALPLDQEKPVAIRAADLLAAFQADERTASARYQGQKIAVTGTLTGVFIPSVDISFRVAEHGGSADAFVTMGGPTPASVEETLLLPGIAAYSEESSLFGQRAMNSVTEQLRVGETVSLNCTFKDALRVSDLAISRYNGELDYSIQLDNCILKENEEANGLRDSEARNASNSSPAQTQQQPSVPSGQEPTGVWSPLSHTAESITGQVILSSAGITILGTTYPLIMERSLGPVEIQSLAQAFSLASGYQSLDARLYQTNIPAAAVLLNGNTICGSEPARWIAAFTISTGSQPELYLMFLAGDLQPALNAEALENSTRVCGTYSYVKPGQN